MKQMIKYYIRFILFGAASFFGIFAILKECEQWFNIKFFKEILIAIGIIISVLTIIASIIFLKRPLTPFDKSIKILRNTVVALGFICFILSSIRIGMLNIERGTDLYLKYGKPFVLCLVSGTMVEILECIK